MAAMGAITKSAFDAIASRGTGPAPRLLTSPLQSRRASGQQDSEAAAQAFGGLLLDSGSVATSTRHFRKRPSDGASRLTVTYDAVLFR